MGRRVDGELEPRGGRRRGRAEGASRAVPRGGRAGTQSASQSAFHRGGRGRRPGAVGGGRAGGMGAPEADPGVKCFSAARAVLSEPRVPGAALGWGETGRRAGGATGTCPGVKAEPSEGPALPGWG